MYFYLFVKYIFVDKLEIYATIRLHAVVPYNKKKIPSSIKQKELK